jgi:hypothetical protein
MNGKRNSLELTDGVPRCPSEGWGAYASP